MIELLQNWKDILAFMALPMGFMLIWAKDLIKLKITLLKDKKKGAKFVVGISTDRSIRISAETPVDKKKFVFKGDEEATLEIPIDPRRLYFAPQFGVQAALITQGGKTLFDPYSDKAIDPIDGEYINVAIQKAKGLRDFGKGWLDTKEQKMLLLILLGVIGVGVLTFANMSQIGEFLNWARPAIQNLVGAAHAAGEVAL